VGKRRYRPEQIISKLPFGFAQGGESAEPREAEVELANLPIAPACADIVHREGIAHGLEEYIIW